MTDTKAVSRGHMYFFPSLVRGSQEYIQECGLCDQECLTAGSKTGWASARELSVLMDFGSETYIDSVHLCGKDGTCSDFIAPFAALHCEVNGKMRMIAFQNNCRELTAPLVMRVDRKTRFVLLSFWHTNHSIGKFMPLPVITIYGDTVSQCPGFISLDEAAKKLSTGSVCVDEYGQCVALEWDGKIHNDSDFQFAIQREEAILKENHTANNDDPYYGIKKSFSRKGTGYFTTGKVDGRWWFFTPDGNPFLMKGVDLICYDESSCYTPIHEKGGNQIRGIFEKLPDAEKYKAAYKTFGDHVEVIDFLECNLMRKYGPDYDAKWAHITRKRLDSWNFNCSAKWLLNPRFQNYTYVYSLGLNQSYVGIQWTVDPFDEAFETKVRENISAELLEHRNDPFLIGYHFGNESGWDQEIVTEVLLDTSGLPAKKAFVQYLSVQSGGIGAIRRILDTDVTDEQALCRIPIDRSRISNETLSGFIRLASQTFFSKVNRVIKQVDSNHLFLGSALTPDWRSCLDWEIGGAEYVDAISLDYYTDDASFLHRYDEVDKPLLNLEFSFTTGERGHRAIFDSISRITERERGEAYRKFVSGMCAFPNFAGFGFFILHDQPVSGRSDYDGSAGEAYQFGLVDVQDNIYHEFCQIVAQTNINLEAVHLSGKYEDRPQ